ncbi:hypothetical protein XBO1_850015 [Xenorhabdus bovienii str. oregonense]|uniref:Uncharacterized protein n=1 Tax=Xenorhabdus bovienii str. oregonense TaxID=1398202 RepID=A0A077PAY2_XENBV|nr:hypothetical protein XBO1_850015 [Xenorhabdus bovienii str. oregonense]
MVVFVEKTNIELKISYMMAHQRENQKMRGSQQRCLHIFNIELLSQNEY